MSTTRVICGTFIHSTYDENVMILTETAVGFSEGKIVFIVGKNELQQKIEELGLLEKNVEFLSRSQFMIPGFVDTHVHASQYSFHGTGMDKGLLDWLNTYTFPVESKFKDEQFAADVYHKVVKRYLKNGTTTASYFGTIHTDATIVLCQIIAKLGQRAFVGKVNMNEGSPDYYIESTNDSILETERFVKAVLDIGNPLITPCITPRFALSCTEDLQVRLGEIARQYNLPIQTHLSECVSEGVLIKSLFPHRLHYLDIYNQSDILNKKTILAHSIYLSDEELEIIKAKGCGISHCPNSNLTLRSGILDTRKIIEMNIKLSLGTDIAGGYSCSMLDAIRHCVQVSNTWAIIEENKGAHYEAINYRHAFKLATLGGAQVLGLDDKIGNFEVGKDFDALLIDVKAHSSNFDVFKEDTIEDIFQKFLFLGDDRNILRVYVAGKQVNGTIATDDLISPGNLKLIDPETI